MKIWAYVMLAVSAIGGFLTFMFTMKKAGRYEERVNQWEKTNESVREANRGKQRLAVDPEYRKRLRKKRTRK